MAYQNHPIGTMFFAQPSTNGWNGTTVILDHSRTSRGGHTIIRISTQRTNWNRSVICDVAIPMPVSSCCGWNYGRKATVVPSPAFWRCWKQQAKWPLNCQIRSIHLSPTNRCIILASVSRSMWNMSPVPASLVLRKQRPLKQVDFSSTPSLMNTVVFAIWNPLRNTIPIHPLSASSIAWEKFLILLSVFRQITASNLQIVWMLNAPIRRLFLNVLWENWGFAISLLSHIRPGTTVKSREAIEKITNTSMLLTNSIPLMTFKNSFRSGIESITISLCDP